MKDYAIFMLDPFGRVASWNRGAERIKGYTAAEIVGAHFSRFYSSDDILAGKPEWELEIAASEGRCEDEGWRIRKDGSRFLANVVISRIADAAGNLVGFAKVTRDVTERKRAEAALRAANQELEAFSYSVAHDLRAPLRGVNAFAQLLLDSYGAKLDAEGHDWLQEILQNARKMGALIDALLSLSRVSRVELKPEQVDMGAVARAVASRLARESPHRMVDLVIQGDVAASIDARLARAVLENLLGNAWKFTSNTPSARIEFLAVETDGVPTFTVRDNGAGFDMEFAEKLFAPFQRLHTEGEFPGTGIGLATVQRIVHRHGGRIWAEGRVNDGAAFHFTLGSQEDARQ